MFYEEKADPGFRFGDIIKGFITVTPRIDNPPLNIGNSDHSIEISNPPFYVVLSPCCSISDKMISLSPLIPVKDSIFNNPHFLEDLTRINRLVPPEKALPPNVYEKLSKEKFDEIMGKGLSYTHMELFIYKENEIFPEYTINRRNEPNLNTKYYMVDFRGIYRVNCSKIITPSNVPSELKHLQLTVKSRSELRDKISFYFARRPDEDIID
jgi:hypothetical protein